MITHDMGVVAEVADRVLVMYGGRVVEQGTKRAIFYDPQHPYTWGLLGSIARLDRPRPQRLTAIPGTPPVAGPPARGLRVRAPLPASLRALLASCRRCVDRVGGAGHLDACWLPIEKRGALR